MSANSLEKVAGLIQDAQGKTLVLTGAGISAESGIPTFRGKEGLWQRYNPEIYACMDGLLEEFKKKPLTIAQYLKDFYQVLIDASPNPAHIALAYLEAKGLLEGLITQNIDNLHQHAGSKNVWEIHGNAFRMYCPSCRRKEVISKEIIIDFLNKLSLSRNKYAVIKNFIKIFHRCECGDWFRTSVVLVGEMLPEEVMEDVHASLEEAKVVLVVGTSATMYPAAGIPFIAKEYGAQIIEINTQNSALSDMVDISIFEEAGTVLPRISNFF